MYNTCDYASLRCCLTNLLYWKCIYGETVLGNIYGETVLGNIFLTNSFYFFFTAYIPCKLRKEITCGRKTGWKFWINFYFHFI